MSHEITSIDGKAQFVYNAQQGLPWHGLGEGHDGFLTAEQVNEVIGFAVEKRVMYRQTVGGLFEPVPGVFETVRQDIDLHLGVVGGVYNPFAGEVATDFGLAIVEETDGSAVFGTAGTLRNSTSIFATIFLGECENLVPGDSSKYGKWLLIRSSHDGTIPLTAAIVLIRVVCANTEQAAMASAPSVWTVKHTTFAKPEERAEEARAALGMATKYEAEFSAIAARMASVEMSLEEFNGFVAAEIIPDAKVRGADKVTKQRAELASTFAHSDLVDDAWRFSNWGAYNAVTRWAEHVREERPDKRTNPREKRMLSTLYNGAVSNIRQRAFTALSAV